MKTLRTALAISALATAALSSAQDIRFFAFHNGGIYEVVTDSNTGGRFVQKNYKVGPIRVNGFTDRVLRNPDCHSGRVDRVERGELFATIILGAGTASNFKVISDRRTLVSLPSLVLPTGDLRNVSTNVFDDNIRLSFDLNGRHFSRRLPIGKRG